MTDFICPVCGAELHREDKCLKCPGGHSYDIARQGYVNLLMSNSSGGRRHGDDKLMVKARNAFLEKGYYRPVLDGILSLLKPRLPGDYRMLDAGCGEGWYTAHGAEVFPNGHISGVDISRDAVMAAAKRTKSVGFAVASAAKLPVRDEYFDAVLNIFSPLEAGEYRRVLKKGGYLIRALPLPEHLWSLKKAVYDEPYLNPEAEEPPEGFECEEYRDVRYTLELSETEDIMNLFAMTPYYYKTGREDQSKLSRLERLAVEVAVRICAYKKV